MPDIKVTEREFQIRAIGWVNEFLSTGSFPFEVASGEASIRTSDGRKFPDVQIWLNRQSCLGFCGWELKTPATPVDDPELLKDAAEKARTMNADYFVTWNMRDTIIWRTPHWTDKVTSEYRYYSYSSLSSITTPEDLLTKEEILKARAREIINDLAKLHRDGHLYQIDTDTTFFVHKLSQAAEKLTPSFLRSLRNLTGRDKRFREELENWTYKQSITNFGDEQFFQTVSRQMVYRLLGKIIFYNTLRRFRTELPKMTLSGLNAESANLKLKEFFEHARKIDYQAIFIDDVPDRVPLPQDSIDILSYLLEDLNRYNFSGMPLDVVGGVFQRLIPSEERHNLGQYFTQENLVDLINAFCIQGANDYVLDPTCGTGTFLVRAYDRLNYLGTREHKRLLSQLWGIDVAPFPAELATINLYRQDLSDYANFPRIDTRDFFEIKPRQKFRFPPPKPTDNPDFAVEVDMPLFDAAVGNFPFIRQELINKKIKGYKYKLEAVLTKDWKAEYRELFDSKGRLKLSGQADIYAYLFFHTARFLKDGGRMGFRGAGIRKLKTITLLNL